MIYQKNRQLTLKNAVEFEDIGLHNGQPVRLKLRPAAPNRGYVFVERSEDGSIISEMVCATMTAPRHDDSQTAGWRPIEGGVLRTQIKLHENRDISTVEHLMAALRGMNVDNVEIELLGDEIPILDGSARRFVDKISAAGLKKQNFPRRYIKILRPVEYSDGVSYCRLEPGIRCEFDVTIEFDHPKIGKQMASYHLTSDNFIKEIASARTFGFERDQEFLHGQQLALGASERNAIVLSEHSLRNVGGLRHSNEFARHKLLDAIGDLALAGAPIIGRYESFAAGHRHNIAILNKLRDSGEGVGYEWVNALPTQARSPDSHPGAPMMV